MKLTEKHERYNIDRTFIGRHKKHKCNINYHNPNWCDNNSYWWFYYEGEDKAFNSLWKELKYNSKEECHDACVRYIDEQEMK